jgi:phosphatidylglycerol lysyltransferase
MVFSGHVATRQVGKRLARAARWSLALLLVVVALANIAAALIALPAIPVEQVNQVVDLDELAWGRAGAIALGLLLLLMARALARGKRQAWILSLAMLSVSLAGALAERAQARSILLILALLVALVALAPAFNRRSDRVSSVRGYIALALGGWLTWGHAFLYHVLKAGHFSFQAPPWVILFPLRFLSYAILAVGLWQLLRPVLRERAGARGEHERAVEVVRRYGLLSTSYFALGPDKRYIWSDTGRTLIPFRVAHGVALALSDPIGPQEEHAQTLEKFIDYSRRLDWPFAIYQVSPATYHLGRQRGLWGFKIGEDALVDLTRFTLAGKAGAPVRHSVARARRGGLTVRIYQNERLPDEVFAGMKRVSSAWLRTRELAGQFGFSMGRFPADWSPEMLTVVAIGPDGDVQAFVTWTPLYAGAGWSLDLIRRGADAIPGAMELLIAESFDWARARECERMSLGLLPLAGLDAATRAMEAAPSPQAALVERSAAYLHRRGVLLATYKSLRHFKEKFQPEWEARYLIASEASATPQILLALASAMGGGWRAMAQDAWKSRRTTGRASSLSRSAGDEPVTRVDRARDAMIC